MTDKCEVVSAHEREENEVDYLEWLNLHMNDCKACLEWWRNMETFYVLCSEER